MGEVEAAVEEGATGEFAGFGKSGTTIEKCLEDCLLDVEGAVAGDFDGVFASVGVGGTEEGDDDFVDEGVAVAKGGESRGLIGSGEVDVAGGNGKGLWTGEPENGDAANA